MTNQYGQRLAGKTAVITGGATGIGLAAASASDSTNLETMTRSDPMAKGFAEVGEDRGRAVSEKRPRRGQTCAMPPSTARSIPVM